MNQRRKRTPQATASEVAAAVRERIARLEEELAHWRQVLRDCENPARHPAHNPQDAPAGAKSR